MSIEFHGRSLCLPVPIALQDHVPEIFKNNSCLFWFSVTLPISFGDFHIHVDIPVGDGYKFMTFLDSCDLKQSVNQPICMVTYWTSFVKSPADAVIGIYEQ